MNHHNRTSAFALSTSGLDVNFDAHASRRMATHLHRHRDNLNRLATTLREFARVMQDGADRLAAD